MDTDGRGGGEKLKEGKLYSDYIVSKKNACLIKGENVLAPLRWFNSSRYQEMDSFGT